MVPKVILDLASDSFKRTCSVEEVAGKRVPQANYSGKVKVSRVRGTRELMN